MQPVPTAAPPPQARARRRIWLAVSASVGLAAATTLAPTLLSSAAAASLGCSVSYTPNQWSGGFTANLVINNTGSSVINGWTLTFTFPGDQKVTNAWNATVTQSGENVTAVAESYNADIAAGANTSFGFQGTWANSDTSPTSFAVNGVACGGGSTTSPSASPTGTTASPTPTGTTASPTPTGTTGSPTPTGTGTGSTGGYPPHVADPFTGGNPFVNPSYVSEVQAQAAADGNNAAEAAVAKYQTALWLDHIGAITGDSSHIGLSAYLNDAVAAASGSTPEVAEIVIYDLPGRDCAALASNGEIPATAAGLTEYESQYIDPIASILNSAAYKNLRIVAVIEPDSLPNVVTNQSKTACATATPYYESGITYALNKLHAIPNVYNYLDIAHSAWLGWSSNMSQTPAVYQKVVLGTSAGYASIDGFISDTANYTPVQEPFLPNPTLQVGGQPLDSATFYQYNPTFDELTYDTDMYNTLVSAGFPASDRFLVDTSRNGWGGSGRPTALNSSPTTPNAYVAANKIDERPFRGDWCNQNNAGIGARPQDEPLGTSSPIEAYVWIKPPGESDGDYPTATHTHGDPHCDPSGTNTDGNGGTYSTGSIPGYDVPAGQWFAYEFQMLVANAYPAL
jgi:cellulose 1,4-beta-cellobiosidase